MQSKKQNVFHQKSKKVNSKPKKTRSKRKVEDMFINELYEKILMEPSHIKRYQYMDKDSKRLIVMIYILFLMTLGLAVWEFFRIKNGLSELVPVNVAVFVFIINFTYSLLSNTRKGFEDRVKSIIEYRKQKGQR